MKQLDLSRKGRTLVKVLFDLVSIALSLILTAFILNTSDMKIVYALTSSALLIAMLNLWHYYNIRLEIGSIEMVARGFGAICSVFLIATIVSLVTNNNHFIPFYFVHLSYFFLFSLGSRFAYRFLRQMRNKEKAKLKNYPRAIIYGAGDIGNMLARRYFNGKLQYELVGYVDDDSSLRHRDILGLPVMGTVDDLATLVKDHEIKTVIIGITNISKEKLYKAVDAAKDNDADVKIIPSLYEMAQGAKEIDLRNLDYPDLLGRPLIKIDRTPVEEMVRGKTVLVTGACGSIGSEICRQLVSIGVERLVMVDIDESSLHDMGLRLTNYTVEINEHIIPILCDIKNTKKVERIFQKYKPDIVYHAAAYKHVPMGEREPDEIIKTNVLGSYNVLISAKNNNVGKVVVISTDKAVNPTNVMGASKRMVELIASLLTSDETEIVAVRFGNVLGSRGSMLPLFIEQIHAGVPITVTHKDIIRYFMAIPEAVSLVMKAGAMAKGGEVMVLDMGEPVRIYDFAQRLIRYYGDERSRIVVTGLRPGEKLYEELLANEDLTIPTDDKRVFKAKLNSHKISYETLLPFLGSLDTLSDVELEQALSSFVPEFSDQHSSHVLG